MIVELITDAGVTGWGESLCHGLQPPEIAATIVQVALKPIVVGHDPFDVDVLWERIYNLTRPYGQKGAVPNAISAVDIGASRRTSTTSCARATASDPVPS